MSLTRPHEAAEGSAARADSSMRVCERCQASLTEEAKVCPECGAPLGPGALSEIPADVHRELARANLLRLRHDLEGAEGICLGILRRYPNSQPAHTLLGDIADERGNLEEAERWYDLALELDPASAGDRRKLEDVRLRRTSSENATTVEQIGLPPRRPVPWFNVAMAALAMVSITAAIILAVKRPSSVGDAKVVVTKPVEVPSDAMAHPAPTSTPESNTEPAVPSPTGGTSEPTATVEPTSGDDTLLRLIAQRSPFGAGLISIQQDPRAKTATLTFDLKADQDPRQVSSELGKATMDLDTEVQTLTLRALQNGQLAYMADMTRTRYAETQTDSWREQNIGNLNAFAQFVLSNEWTPETTPNTGVTSQP